MAVTQEPVVSQPINEVEGSTPRVSSDYENDSHPSQIEGDRTFLGWLILPLLSLCSCGRGEKNADEDEAIHPFPHTLDSPQCLTQPMARSLPIEIHTAVEKVPEIQSEVAESRDCTTITRYEAYAGYGSEVRSGGDLTLGNSSLDDIDHLHLLDLPLLPLLTICEFLFGDGSECRDIYNLRNTCNSLAAIVNIFFQNPTKIPKIETVNVQVNSNTIQMVVKMSPTNYLLHPLNSELDFNSEISRSVGKTVIKTSFDVKRDVATIERATKFLRGPVACFHLFLGFDFESGTAPAEAVLKLLANYSLEAIHCRHYAFNKQFCDFLLSVLRNQTKPRAYIAAYRTVMSSVDSEFLDDLDSLTNGVTLQQADGQQLLSLPLSFWQQWLSRKLVKGDTARYNFQPFTTHTDLTQLERPLNRIDWGVD